MDIIIEMQSFSYRYIGKTGTALLPKRQQRIVASEMTIALDARSPTTGAILNRQRYVSLVARELQIR
jgi:hypothetical protein